MGILGQAVSSVLIVVAVLGIVYGVAYWFTAGICHAINNHLRMKTTVNHIYTAVTKQDTL